MRQCVQSLDAPLTSESKRLSSGCELQSDEVEEVLTGTTASDTTHTTVVEFLDETPGGIWSVDSIQRSNLNDQQSETELAKFLSRPVLIKTHTWAQADNYNTTTTWYPWHLFFNSTSIKNKITNYGLINCKLKLKFVVNAAPFYSGAMAFTYCPLQDINGTTIIPDASGNELMLHSQRPKCWIFPQTCQGGELELPFFYHKNWLNLTSAADLKAMGTITPCLFAQLNSCNGVTGTSIVVNVYAWAEDIKLHAPTMAAPLQADEFDSKPSQIASSVSKAAGNLSRIPIIGPYMKATSVVSSTFSKFASSLGFTNVPNIDKVSALRPTPFPHNSTCDISVYTDRAAVDPKNEVSIDPRTVGLDGTDEMSVKYIAQREAWIGNAILSSTDAVDALTLVSRVTPAIMNRYSSTTPNQYTPMGYLCEMFKHWRGDIIFRFKFICTRFHKGRVRITYDPIQNISTTIPDYTSVFNEVLDIGAEQDIEVRVPYMQATTYLRTALQTGNYNLSGSALAPSADCNGLLTMRVVNPLSGPVANTAIPVMVFVRAADNIDFAWPSLTGQATTTNLTPYALQSREFEYPIEPCQVVAGNSVSEGDPNRNLIHYGESIASLRPLVHRLYLSHTIQPTASATGNPLTINNLYQSRRLKYFGYDTNGPWTAKNQAGTSNVNFSWVRMSIPQLVSLLYIGQRGSITWSYNVESTMGTPPARLTLSRYDNTITRTSYVSQNTSTNATNGSISGDLMAWIKDPGSGTALTDQRSQPAVNMNFPYYSLYNFQMVNPSTAVLGSSADGTDEDNILLQMSNQTPAIATTFRVHAWVGLGPDYNFFFFINTPSLYFIANPVGV
nr:MAG: hypothetical protein 2 [Marnaviridae sp.]